MTAKEAAEAVAWWTLEYRGEKRRDWGAAIVAQTIAAAAGKEIPLETFMPKFGEKKPVQSEAEMKSALHTMMKRWAKAKERRDGNANPNGN